LPQNGTRVPNLIFPDFGIRFTQKALMPELLNSRARVQCFETDAHVERHKKITAFTHSHDRYGRYGRYIADLIADGVYINKALVESGAACFFKCDRFTTQLGVNTRIDIVAFSRIHLVGFGAVFRGDVVIHGRGDRICAAAM